MNRGSIQKEPQLIKRSQVDSSYDERIEQLEKKLVEKSMKWEQENKDLQDKIKTAVEQYQQKIKQCYNHNQSGFNSSFIALLNQKDRKIIQQMKRICQLQKLAMQLKYKESNIDHLNAENKNLKQINNQLKQQLAKKQKKIQVLHQELSILQEKKRILEKQLQERNQEIKDLKQTQKNIIENSNKKLESQTKCAKKGTQILKKIKESVSIFFKEHLHQNLKIQFEISEDLISLVPQLIKQLLFFQKFNQMNQNLLQQAKKQGGLANLSSSQPWEQIKALYQSNFELRNDKIKINEPFLCYITAHNFQQILALFISDIGKSQIQAQEFSKNLFQISQKLDESNSLLKKSQQSLSEINQAIVVLVKALNSISYDENIEPLSRNQVSNYQQLSKIIINFNNLINFHNKKKKKWDNEKQSFQKQIRGLNQQIIELRGRLKQQRSSLGSQIQLNRKQSQKSNQKIVELQKIKNLLDQKIKQKERIIQINIEDAQKRQNQILEKQSELNALQQKLKILVDQNKLLTNQKGQLQVKAHKMSANLSDILTEVLEQEVSLTLQTQQKSLKYIKTLLINKINIPLYLVQSKLFNGLPKQSRKFIEKEINELMMKKICSSKTIHEPNPQSSSMQWLKKIIGRPNIFMLLKLINGSIIAGFSQEPYTNNIKKQGLGFIMSVTNHKKYSLKRRPDASILKYGPYFFTFGNDELVIKGNGVVTSIFGTAQTYFDSEGDRLDALFGSNINKEVRQIKYSQLEFHELFFE